MKPITIMALTSLALFVGACQPQSKTRYDVVGQMPLTPQQQADQQEQWTAQRKLAQRAILLAQEQATQQARLPDLKLLIPKNEPGVTWPQPFLPPTPADVIDHVDALLVPPPEYSRPDRFVTLNGIHLNIYAAMQTHPLARIDIGDSDVRLVAWCGDTLIAERLGRLIAIDAVAGKVKWRRTYIEPEGGYEFQQLLGDRVLMEDSVGHLYALDVADGHCLWTGEKRGRITIANNNFIVILDDIDAGKMSCLDARTGRIIGPPCVIPSTTGNKADQAFVAELSPDNILAYTDGKRLFVKGLSLGWTTPALQSSDILGQPVSPRRGIGPGLAIAGDRVAVLWDNAPDADLPTDVCVRIFSLRTAQPIRMQTSKGPRDVTIPLPSPRNIQLETVGSWLYLIGGPSGVIACNLDTPTERWSPLPGMISPASTIFDQIIGRNHMLLLTEPSDSHSQPASLGIYAFARYPSGPRQTDESGRCDYCPASDPRCTIHGRADIRAVQGVDGGIIYLTGDGKLHLLRGAGN